MLNFIFLIFISKHSTLSAHLERDVDKRSVYRKLSHRPVNENNFLVIELSSLTRSLSFRRSAFNALAQVEAVRSFDQSRSGANFKTNARRSAGRPFRAVRSTMYSSVTLVQPRRSFRFVSCCPSRAYRLFAPRVHARSREVKRAAAIRIAFVYTKMFGDEKYRFFHGTSGMRQDRAGSHRPCPDSARFFSAMRERPSLAR